MEWIELRSGHHHMHQAAEGFGPQRAMDEPLLIPDGLQRTRRDLGDERLDVWCAESAEALLICRGDIRIPRVKWCADIDQIKTGVEVGLEPHIDMDVGGEIASIAAIASHRTD